MGQVRGPSVGIPNMGKFPCSVGPWAVRGPQVVLQSIGEATPSLKARRQWFEGPSSLLEAVRWNPLLGGRHQWRRDPDVPIYGDGLSAHLPDPSDAFQTLVGIRVPKNLCIKSSRARTSHSPGYGESRLSVEKSRIWLVLNDPDATAESMCPATKGRSPLSANRGLCQQIRCCYQPRITPTLPAPGNSTIVSQTSPYGAPFTSPLPPLTHASRRITLPIVLFCAWRARGNGHN